MIQNFKLIEKTNLTENVFELTFEGEKELDIKPGQFITFLLDKIGGRAYSILKIEGKNVVLIIKKRELEEGGRGGSIYICDLNVGESLRGVGPAGHFILQQNEKNKLFIGTGTGFVPLYNQIVGALNNKQSFNLKFIFGVREEKDIFYIKQLDLLKENNNNFDYEIFLSRSDVIGTHRGYVTDFFTQENIINKFDEFYICGAPAMIDSSIEKLKEIGINEGCIFYEKY